MKPAKTAPEPKRLPVALLSGLLAAYAFTCAIFIGCALALAYTPLKESAVPFVVTVTCVVSVIIAGFDASRAARSRGWLWGMVAGGLYAVVLFLLLLIVAKTFTVDARKVTLLFLALAGGALGGMIGIQGKR